MLYEPGPIDLFPDTEIPAPGVPVADDGIAAEQAQVYLDGAAALEQSGGALATAGADVDDAGAALDVGAAATELAEQPADVSPELVAAAGGVDALDGDLAGIQNELLGDLASGEPPQPTIPPNYEPEPVPTDTAPPDTQEPPRDYEPAPDGLSVAGCYGPACRDQYRARLDAWFVANVGRNATSDELLTIDRFMGTYGFLSDDAFAWIIDNWIRPAL